MAVKEFELYHGAVLAKLVRGDRPVALKMIETRSGTDWSTYTLNDQVNLLIAHSKSAKSLSQGGHSWQFVLSANQMRQIARPKNGKDVYLALVCIQPNVSTEVCLLFPDEIARVLEMKAYQQTVTVRKPARGQFCVMHDYRKAFTTPRNRLDKWEVPGS